MSFLRPSFPVSEMPFSASDYNIECYLWQCRERYGILHVSNEQCQNAICQNACWQMILTDYILIGRMSVTSENHRFFEVRLINELRYCETARKDKRHETDFLECKRSAGLCG